MDSSGGISKIYWPTHVSLHSRKSGYIVGWNYRSFVVCVAAVVDDVKLTDLEMKLKVIEADPEQAHWKQFCGVSPVVLGVWVVDEDIDNEIFQLDEIADRKETANIWMTVERQKNLFPLLRTVYCLGYRYQPSSEVLFYTQPTLRTPLTLDPLVLDVSFKDESAHKKEKSKDKGVLIQRKLKIHTSFTTSPIKSPESKSEIQFIVNQINTSPKLERLLSTVTLPLQLARRPSVADTMQAVDELSASADERASNSSLASAAEVPPAQDSQDESDHSTDESTPAEVATSQTPVATSQAPVSKKGRTPLWLWVFMAIAFSFRCFSEAVFALVAFRVTLLRQWSLKDISAAAVQSHLRLKQACSWPINYILVKQHWESDLKKALAVEINLYNSIWLVINDITLGIALGMFLYANIPTVVAFLHSHIEYYSMDRVAEMVTWLMGWPSGIKLNNNLDNFLGQMFLLFTSWWRALHLYFWPHMPVILTVISYSGILGATMIVALLQDLSTLLFLNLWAFYTISATLYNWQLGVLSSLFHLFRGQKNNVLRKRIDSSDYDVEQLLLGTLLFTLVSLLVPTVMVYYVLFAGFRLYTLSIQGSLQLILALLNHFPLFSLTLCLQSSRRLPGGFTIEMGDPKMLTHPKPSFLETLFSQPEKSTQDSGHPASAHQGASPPEDRGQMPQRIHESIPEHEEDAGNYQPQKITRPFVSRRKKTHTRAVSIGNWQPTPSLTGPQVTYLIIQPKVIPFSQIFFQYILLGKRLMDHFKPSYIIHCLLVGAPIATVRKLQHPLISYQTPPLSKLWAYLKENFA